MHGLMLSKTLGGTTATLPEVNPRYRSVQTSMNIAGIKALVEIYSIATMEILLVRRISYV